MKLVRPIAIAVVLAGRVLAGEVLDSLVVDGQRYESVKWGTVNQGKVVIFHSRGVAIVPIEKLPEEYQAKFAEKPKAALKTVTSPTSTAPASPQTDPRQILEAMRAKRDEPAERPKASGDWANYNRDRSQKVLLEGKLVEKAKLVTLTGFLVRDRAQVTMDERTVRGAVLELAERKDDAGAVAPSMELRPAFWKRTGEMVWLSNYKPETLNGGLMRVYAAEIESIDNRRVYKVGIEPTFEQWQALNRR